MRSGHPARLGPDGRYELGRQIGQGGFGTVFAARDTSYASDVAVKLLRRADADALYRFKGEFRSLADIDHPNLVRLYELGVDGGHWFVVMELVDGVDLLRWVWGEDSKPVDTAVTAPRGTLLMTKTRETPRADRDRLRNAFAQVARGLIAIHDAGKLHRDLKPSNVLVTRDERAVILDFGLLLDAHDKPGVLTGSGIGTPGYMAPEQLIGGALTPAVDWYAFGAMLHEALTGTLPRNGPSSLLPSDELGSLCRALLEPEAVKRKGGKDVLAALSAESISRPATASSSALVGREKEIAALDEAWAVATQSSLALRLIGVSGVGKSTLLDAWLARMRAVTSKSPLVLRGRCLEHENVPFKAIDGVIDALAAYLADTDEPELPSVGPASRMFPVLARPPDRVEGKDDSGDTFARRQRALACLRRVLTHMAKQHGLVICIDDVQWADVEGIRALADLVEPRTPGLFVVLAQRPDVEISRAIEEWVRESHVPTRTLDLAVLDEDDALDLARSRVGEALAARVVREAAGNPFLIHQLADYHRSEGAPEGPIDVADLVAQKIGRLGPSGRGLVEVVALAATPLDQRVLIDAAEIGGLDARGAMQAAEQNRLLAGARVDGVHVFTTLHDRVREEVVRQIEPARLRSLHRRIAGALIEHGFDAPEILLHHHLGADDLDAATDAAVRAAEHAENVLAFERAAEHYGTILRLGRREGERSRLHAKRGSALSNAGRAAEAAEAFQEAARTFGPTKSDEDVRALRALHRQSGELSLRSGHVEVGKAILAECLIQVGVSLPKSATSAMFASARRRLWFFARGFAFEPRVESEISPKDLERLDVMWGATTSLTMLEPLVADSIGSLHLLEALRLGEKKRVLRSLAFEVSFESIIGGSFLEKRSAKLIERMEMLSSEIDEPYFKAWTLMAHGISSWADSNFVASWKYCSEASTILRRDTRGTTWELAVTDVYGLSSLSYIGDVSTMERIVPEGHRIARERGDRYATANLAFFESFVELAHDNPMRARELAERAIEPFPKSKVLSVHYGIAYAIAQSYLYEGNVGAAWSLIEADFPSWKKLGMLNVRTAKVEIRYLRARTSLAMLERSPRHALARKWIAEDLSALERETSSFGKSAVLTIRAALAKIAGKSKDAASLLERTIVEFEKGGLKLHACAARRHAERLRGDEPTTVLPNVTSSERMSHLLLAGFRP